MAKEIVQLEGGPDNGVELIYDVPPALPPKITYSGSVYDNANATKKDSAGNLVHEFRFNAAASAGVTAAHAHKGWSDLRHSINHTMPAAIHSAQRSTAAALRSVSSGRKVKG